MTTNRYLEKIAKTSPPAAEVASSTTPTKKPPKKAKFTPSPMRPHHLRVLRKLETDDGVILDHSTGSGKTRLFLEAIARAQAKNKKGKSIVFAPASLVTNIDKEIKKHHINIDRSRLEALSYEKAVIEAPRLRKVHYDIAVADEAHKLRETKTQRFRQLSEIISNADKRLLATATPSYNQVSDLAPLVNIAAGQEVLPNDRKKFDNKYLRQVLNPQSTFHALMGKAPGTHVELRDKDNLAKTLSKYIDTYDLAKDPDAAKHFPTKVETHHEIEMSPEQDKVYRYIEGRMPFMLRMKLRMNLPLEKKEMASLNSFSTGIRQASNSTRPYQKNYTGTSPKIQAAVRSLVKSHGSDKNFRGVVYSNYLGAGLDEYSAELNKAGIPHTVYNGKLSRAEKDLAVKEYNTGKKPVLLVSSSGAEGLDLKGTKKMQVLEPHFNVSKIRQVVGRGIRYMSHDHLPEAERKVEVEHYYSISPKGFMGRKGPTTIDQYLRDHSEDKQGLSTQIRNLVLAEQTKNEKAESQKAEEEKADDKPLKKEK